MTPGATEPSLADLSPATVDAIARRTAELLATRLQDNCLPARAILIDAAEVARRYGVSRGWVYEHAVELGAIRLGDGRVRPRLRFDPTTLAERLRAREAGERSERPDPAPGARRRTGGSQRAGTSAERVPVRGPVRLESTPIRQV